MAMSSTDLERRRPTRILLLVVIGLIGVALGIRLATWLPGLAIWRSGTTGSAAKQAEEASAAANPMLVRQGETIFIPEGSPYRDRLKIAPVEAETMRAMRVLPANVEADATRTVSILPPVTGRVLELKVRLGDEVKQGQALN
jgi:multidrug efflux pump subunit AcrA (membrane-fusion protein)